MWCNVGLTDGVNVNPSMEVARLFDCGNGVADAELTGNLDDS